MKLPIGFAMHQYKRDKVFREPIRPPPGYGILEVDSAGQEFRWMAEASGDEVMKSLCMPGEDPHSYMSVQIEPKWTYQEFMRLNKEGDELVGNIRKAGKVSNLSLQYRTSAAKLLTVARVDYGLDMTMREAVHNHAVYPRTYKGVPKYWTKAIGVVQQTGYAETFGGRRVRVAGDWTSRLAWSMGSTAINFKIQGTGADQKYLAIACLKNLMHKAGAWLALEFHDGLYYFVPLDKLKQIASSAKRILDNLPYRQAWGYEPSIPFPWDAKIGPNWGMLKEFRE